MKLWGFDVVVDERVEPGVYYFMSKPDFNEVHHIVASSEEEAEKLLRDEQAQAALRRAWKVSGLSA